MSFVLQSSLKGFKMKKICLIMLYLTVFFAINAKNNDEGIKIEKSEVIKKESNFMGDYQKNDINYSGLTDLIINPFNALGSLASYHVIAFFEGHDKYECVEAFIFQNEHSGEYSFRAIMTDHQNNQIDYVTSKELYEVRKNSKLDINREVKYTDGNFHLDKNGTDYILQFNIDNENEVRIVYIGMGKPESQWGGITDPGGHSPDGGLPMMYRSKSSIGTQNSYVRINNIKYDIAIDESISHKPFFIGYSTFFSEDYYFTLLPTYESLIDKDEYILNKDIDNQFTIQNQSTINILYINPNNNYNEIVKIRNKSSFSTDKNAYMDMDFNPPFPNVNAMEVGESTQIKFAISYNTSNSEEVYGYLKVNKKTNNDINIQLLPSYPGWAKNNRKMTYNITLKEEKIFMKAGMLND